MKSGSVDFFAVNPPTSVKFNGTDVRLPKELFYFAAAKKVFEPEIKRVCDKAMEEFDENVGTLDKFVEKAEDWFVEAVRPLFTFSIDRLAEYGSYQLDEKSFFAQYASDDFDRIAEIHREMTEKYNEIRRQQEERNAERKADRDAKGRWEKRSLFEMGADYLSDKVAEGIEEIGNHAFKYEKVFSSEKKEELRYELLYICNKVLEDFTLALYDTTGKDLRNPIQYEDEEKGKIIFGKLKKGVIAELRRPEAALEAFMANPLLNGFLPWCVETFGDKDGEFQHIARLFNLEDEVVLTKDGILENVVKIDTEQNALASRDHLIQLENTLSYKNPKYENKVNQAIVTFDRKARTVDGVEYKTREEAKLAKNEHEMFDKIAKRHPQINSVSCHAFVQELERASFQTEGGRKLLQQARHALEQCEAEERQFREKNNITPEESVALQGQVSLIKRYGESNIIPIEPYSFDARQKASSYNIQDDSIFGWIDLGNDNSLILSVNGVFVKIKKSTILSSIKNSFKNMVNTIKKHPLLLIGCAITVPSKVICDIITSKPTDGADKYLPWDTLNVELSNQQDDILVLNNDIVVTFANKKLASKKEKIKKLLEKLASLKGKGIPLLTPANTSATIAKTTERNVETKPNAE